MKKIAEYRTGYGSKPLPGPNRLAGPQGRVIQWVLIGSIVLGGLLVNTVSAQMRRPRRAAPPPREKLELLRELKLLEVLDLTEEQSANFLPAFKGFQKKRGILAEKHDLLIRDLELALSEGDTDEQTLKQKLDKIEQNRRDQLQLRVEFYQKSQRILSTEQLARMLIFEQRFERELLQILERMRQDRPQP